MYPNEVIDEVVSRTDIADLISQYVQLKRAGREFIGLCPFHEDNSPSFTVSPAKQMFYCFGCQTGGSALTFVMKKEGFTVSEAAEFLAERNGMTLPEKSVQQAKKSKERKGLQAVLQSAAELFSRQLAGPKGKQAREYLHRRGITDEIQATFQLGYSLPGWHNIERSLGKYGVDALARAGLIVKSQTRSGYYDRFRNRLMFPIRDHAGRVVGFGGRALAPDDDPKYLNSPETPVFNKRRIWYGLDQARMHISSDDSAIVVEGYMDLIATHMAGFNTAVAALGTSLSTEQAMTLSRLAQRIIIAFDADAGGEAATIRGLGMFTRHGARVLVCVLPAGEDPDSVIKSGGPEAFQALLDAAVPLYDYRLQKVYEQYRANGVEDKMVCVRQAIPVLLDIEDQVELDHYAGQVALKLGIEKTALLAEMSRTRLKHKASQARNNKGVKRNRGNETSSEDDEWSSVTGSVDGENIADARAERDLIEIMLSEDGSELAKQCDPELFVDPVYKEIANAIVDSAGDEGGSLVTRVLSRLESDRAQSVVSELAMSDGNEDSGKIAGALIRKLTGRPLRQRILQLQREIADRESRGEAVDIALVTELNRLVREAKGVQ